METHFPIYKKPIMCKHCEQYTTTPLWVTKEMGRGTLQYAFCNEEHAHAFYIAHLQRAK